MRRTDSSKSGEGGGNTSTSIVPCPACSTATEPAETPIARAISSGISITQLSPALWGMSSLLIKFYLAASARPLRFFTPAILHRRDLGHEQNRSRQIFRIGIA